MWKQLSYKRKNIVLGISFLFVSILAYQLSVKETLNIRNEWKKQILEAKKAENAPSIIKELKAEMAQLSSQLGSAGQDAKNGLQERALDFLSKHCPNHHLEIQEFPSPSIELKDGYTIETAHFEIEGRFTDLLRLVHLMEREIKLGRIVSVNFERRILNRTKQIKLYATIYVQEIHNAT